MAQSDTRRGNAKTSGATLEKKKPGRRTSKGRMRLRVILLLLIIIILLPLLLVYFITESQNSLIYSEVSRMPSRPVALVFGAGLNRDGTPSWMLADRIDAGIALYKNGKVQKLMMTGDGIENNEVNAMSLYAQQRGVPVSAIIKDSGGLRTYDSCWRALNKFQIHSAILVTQGYHLPRALYLCNSLGINSVGLKAGLERYPGQDSYNSREFLAILGSWIDINIFKPTPEASR
ncbi:ElyC/SanA/YdcF family protein [Candidatus Chlorohelix sp.]|uniref:SanA/YdcF family protein n=1 Tax=Candidatus Chlorohelix sp. TaxID=3139201 RepID=UPI00305990B0